MCPIAATISVAERTVAAWKFETRTFLFVTSRPLERFFCCVVMPVGQVLALHCDEGKLTS